MHLYHFYRTLLFVSFWLKCAFDVTLWALFWFFVLDRSHFRFFKIFAWLPKVPKLIHLYHYLRTVWYLFLPLCYLLILKYAFWVLLCASFWILDVGIGDYWFSNIFLWLFQGQKHYTYRLIPPPTDSMVTIVTSALFII